jgi:hypothetical protein
MRHEKKPLGFACAPVMEPAVELVQGDEGAVVFSSGADSVVAALLSSSKSWAALPSEDALPKVFTSVGAGAGAGGPAPDFRRPGRPSDFSSGAGAGTQAGRRSRLGLGASHGGGAAGSGGGPARAAASGVAGVLLKRVHRDAWRKQLRRKDEEDVLARGAAAAGLYGDSEDEEDEESRFVCRDPSQRDCVYDCVCWAYVVARLFCASGACRDACSGAARKLMG